MSCSGAQSSPEGWFAERGRTSQNWYVCARAGASLRAECNADLRCESRVTEELTLSCYTARYQASAHESARPFSARELSPCFWDREPQPKASPLAFATEECKKLGLRAELEPHCVAEVRTVIEDVCRRGGTELTGAGP